MSSFVIYLGEGAVRYYVVSFNPTSNMASLTRSPGLAQDTTPEHAIEVARWMRALTGRPYQTTSLSEANQHHTDNPPREN